MVETFEPRWGALLSHADTLSLSGKPLSMLTQNPYYHTEGGKLLFNMTLNKGMSLSENIRQFITFLFRPGDTDVDKFNELFTLWKQQLIVLNENQQMFNCTTPPKLGMRTPRTDDCAREGALVVVMASDLRFFDNLRNLVASIQSWEPNTRMVIYDLGLDPDQITEAVTWINVELRRFPWYCFLKPHFAMPKSNAWKPIVLSLVLDEFDCVLYLDAGMELRAPLNEVRNRIQTDGASLGFSFPCATTRPSLECGLQTISPFPYFPISLYQFPIPLFLLALP